MACVFLYKNTNTNPQKDTSLYHKTTEKTLINATNTKEIFRV